MLPSLSQTSPIFYQSRGQSDSTLILLHGWGFQHQVWNALTASLAADWQTYAVDLPGYGRSPSLPDADLDKLTDLLAAQLPRGVWLGWSLGGLLAINMALRHPDQVQGLYLVGTTPRFVQAVDWPHAMTDIVWQGFADRLQQDWYNTLQRFLALQVKGDAQARDLLRDLRRSFKPDSAPAPSVLKQGLQLLRETDLRCQIAALRCPVCVSLGAQDALVPIAVKQDWQHLLAELPTTTPWDIKVFPKAAHMPFASHLEAFSEHLCQWLHTYTQPT